MNLRNDFFGPIEIVEINLRLILFCAMIEVLKLIAQKFSKMPRTRRVILRNITSMGGLSLGTVAFVFLALGWDSPNRRKNDMFPCHLGVVVVGWGFAASWVGQLSNHKRGMRSWCCLVYSDLGGGFIFLKISPLFGEMIHFDQNFSDGLKPPTSAAIKDGCLRKHGVLFFFLGIFQKKWP